MLLILHSMAKVSLHIVLLSGPNLKQMPQKKEVMSEPGNTHKASHQPCDTSLLLNAGCGHKPEVLAFLKDAITQHRAMGNSAFECFLDIGD